MFDGQPKELEIYETPAGACPFNEWISGLRDKPTREYIINWLFKLRAGNSCDFDTVGEGVLELRDKRRGPGFSCTLLLPDSLSFYYWVVVTSAPNHATSNRQKPLGVSINNGRNDYDF